ncbi:MAG TPA: sigma factor [Candidatus Baltobacteraceae bacterium]|nr:sigma factor [Candidatus Baltobacteraceae bacterium]
MQRPTSEPGPQSDCFGAAQFGQTHWSVVLSAAGRQNPGDAAESLEKLCSLYWRPLYAFIRRQGETPHDAQDLTQEFFLRLLQKDYLNSVDRGKGRFRSFLLAALKHFLSNERDKARAQKRGGGQLPMPLDFTGEETHLSFEAADKLTPEILYERRWATTLLEQALARLRRDYADQGKEPLFEQLKSTLTEGRGGAAYAALAANLKMSEAAVKMAVHRLRQRYRECLRAEIAQTVATAGEIEDELRQVMGAFAK